MIHHPRHRVSYRRRRPDARLAWPTWLMVLLLTIPCGFISSTAMRLLASQSEESAPLAPAEEESEEGRNDLGGWQLVNRSLCCATAKVLPEDIAARASDPCWCEASSRSLTTTLHNGCGAVLRC